MPDAITTNVSVHNCKIYLMAWHRPIVRTGYITLNFLYTFANTFDIDKSYFRRYCLSYN